MAVAHFAALLVPVVLLALCGQASADCTYTRDCPDAISWLANNASWSTPSAWDRGRVPCSGEAIVVPTGLVMVAASVELVVSMINMELNTEIIFSPNTGISFDLAANPACPNKLSPIVTSAINPSDVTVSWTALAGATSYDVQLLNDTNDVTKSSTTTDTSFTITCLTPSTPYRIRVTAKLGDGSTSSNVVVVTTTAGVATCIVTTTSTSTPSTSTTTTTTTTSTTTTTTTTTSTTTTTTTTTTTKTTTTTTKTTTTKTTTTTSTTTTTTTTTTAEATVAPTIGVNPDEVKGTSGSSLPIIPIAAGAGGGVLLLLIIVVIVVRRRRRKAGTVRADPGYSSTVPNPAFTPHVDGRTQTMFARPRGDRVYDKTAGDGPTYEEAGSGGPPNLYERIDPDTGETYARAGPPKRDLGPIYDLGDAPTYEETKPSRGAGHSLYDLGTESSADHYEALPEEKGGYFMVDSSVPATAAVYDAASPGDRRGTQASRAWDSSTYVMDARAAGAEGAGKARTSITWDSAKYNVATSDGDRRQTLWAVPKDEAA